MSMDKVLAVFCCYVAEWGLETKNPRRDQTVTVTLGWKVYGTDMFLLSKLVLLYIKLALVTDSNEL